MEATELTLKEMQEKLTFLEMYSFKLIETIDTRGRAAFIYPLSHDQLSKHPAWHIRIRARNRMGAGPMSLVQEFQATQNKLSDKEMAAKSWLHKVQ